MVAPAYPYPPDPNAAPPWSQRLRRGLAPALIELAAANSLSPRPVAANAGRLLLIRPDHVGDLLLCSPALHWLRAQLPQAHITLAVGPWARAVLPALAGAYDALLQVSFPAFERGPRAGLLARWLMLPRLAARLRPQDFDAALILRPDHWWGAMLARLAHIPRRMGWRTPDAGPFLSEALPMQRQHNAARNLQLVAALADRPLRPRPAEHPLRFPVQPRDAAALQRLLEDLPQAAVNAAWRVVIHPGSGGAAKLWSAAAWGQVAQALHQRGAAVFITGSAGERGLAAAVVAASRGRAVDLSGRTDFGVLAALLASADLVLGPDSGPLHLAVAVGAATVHLFGPTDPVQFGPWGDASRHLVLSAGWGCAPCGHLTWPDLHRHGCVTGITPEQVIHAADLLLN